MTAILLVDDDEAFRTMMTRTLTRAGHDVVEAGDGRTALRMLDSHPVDLMITDIIMPDKEGIETIVAVRKSHPELKIIAMSGGGRVRADDYLEMAQGLGAFRVLRKPFESEELFKAIREALP